MSVPSEPQRARADACPGALQVHPAADGGLARIRVPGGQITAGQMRELGELIGRYGHGQLELTSRANLQIRGLSDTTGLADRLAAAGLLPAPSHERVRNILASPRTGLDDLGRLDMSGLVGELDAALCAGPTLAELPGRFLFALDDGRGDLLGARADVTVHALGPRTCALLLGGTDTGIRVDPVGAVPVAIQAAEAFLHLRGSAWRISELEDGAARIAARIGGKPHPHQGEPGRPSPSSPAPVGVVARGARAVTVEIGARLGRLSRTQIATLVRAAGAGNGALRITPWRTVIVSELPVGDLEQWLDTLRTSGFIVESDSAWTGVTACAGRPGCAKSWADVQSDAAAAVRAQQVGAGRAVHWSGCERRCGRPRGDVIDVIATATGYQIHIGDEVHAAPVDAEETFAALAAARRTA